MNTVRSEGDLMGAIDVLADKSWGIQTQRSPEHSRTSTEGMPTSLIHVLALAKRTAAKVGEDLDLLSEEKASAVRRTAGEILVGQHDGEFPLVIWQTGSGTQSNMNMNEMLANRASELLSGVRGMERKVHPNDDVSKNQSSNDAFPTAMHIAALLALHRQLIPQLKAPIQTLSGKSHAFADIAKTGRTHLQDAMPLILGQGIPDWVAMLEHNLKHIEYGLPHVAGLALGGTAVGTGLDVHPECVCRIADELAVIICAPFVTAPNKSEMLVICDALVQAHGALRGLVVSLMKIANDVRWPASGPHCGTGGILIPENEPDSSIMPGKANPTQCEALTVPYCQVMGSNVAINIGSASSNFELNVFRLMVVHSFLQSARLLADGMGSLSKHCAVGIEPGRERISRLFNESLVLMTALNTHIGHDKAVEIAEKAHKEGLILKAATFALGYLSEAEFDRWVRSERMVDSMKTKG